MTSVSRPPLHEEAFDALQGPRASRRRLASFLLIRMVGALALLAACFAPQEILLFEEPTVFNQPPTIDLRTATPTRPVCLSGAVGDDVEQPTLRALVTDPNGAVGQPLEARWFIDYEPGATSTLSSVLTKPLFPLQLGEDFSYPPLELGPEIIRRLRLVSGIHQVEVVVSDGFDDQAQPRNRAPSLGDCGTLKGPCYVVSHKWTIEFLENAPCPD